MICSLHPMSISFRLLRTVLFTGFSCFVFMTLVEPFAYSEVKTEKFKIATMGSKCYWRLFDDQRVFYGALFPKDNFIEVSYSPEMFLDKSSGNIKLKGTFEFSTNELMVMSERDPNEAMLWKNSFLGDDYLAASKFPIISFETKQITLYKPGDSETTNAKVIGILSIMGEKKPLEFSSHLGIGGGFLIAKTDFELPKNVFVKQATNGYNLAQRLVGKKILIKLKLVAQRISDSSG